MSNASTHTDTTPLRGCPAPLTWVAVGGGVPSPLVGLPGWNRPLVMVHGEEALLQKNSPAFCIIIYSPEKRGGSRSVSR